MEACEKAGTDALIINTSYSDAVIPWLKSAGKTYPDFGSGNLNHLIPRIKYAAADLLNVKDFWNIDVIFAAGHFHDVCISKEGHAEGVNLPLRIFYRNEEQRLPQDEIFKACKIAMPTDGQRNMMNASSNYAIIKAIMDAVRSKREQMVFIPGAFGNIGGYPLKIGYKKGTLDIWIDESVFPFSEMNKANQVSMYLDGIENINDGILYYTDELIEKAQKAFNVQLPKAVKYLSLIHI